MIFVGLMLARDGNVAYTVPVSSECQEDCGWPLSIKDADAPRCTLHVVPREAAGLLGSRVPYSRVESPSSTFRQIVR
jgi:hypothetical protein